MTRLSELSSNRPFAQETAATTIRRLLLATVVLVAAAPTAFAQSPRADFPHVEVFVGYSRLPADGDDFPRPNSHGVLLDVAGNLTPWFGVIGELAWFRGSASDLGPFWEGQKAETSVRQALIGARFTGRGDRVDVYVHGLVGSTTGDAGPGFEGFSDSGFTFGGGGGGEVRFHDRLGARIQVDWIGSFADIVEANLRYAGGLVVRF